MSYSIRDEGVRELRSALKEVEGGLKDFRGEMKRVAAPVVEEAPSMGSRYAGIGKFNPRTSGTTVAVQQSARKVTGQRGDFGALQMRTVLEPALDAREGEVIEILEDVLDGLINKAGL